MIIKSNWDNPYLVHRSRQGVLTIFGSEGLNHSAAAARAQINRVTPFYLQYHHLRSFGPSFTFPSGSSTSFFLIKSIINQKIEFLWCRSRASMTRRPLLRIFVPRSSSSEHLWNPYGGYDCQLHDECWVWVGVGLSTDFPQATFCGFSAAEVNMGRGLGASLYCAFLCRYAFIELWGSRAKGQYDDFMMIWGGRGCSWNKGFSVSSFEILGR